MVDKVIYGAILITVLAVQCTGRSDKESKSAGHGFSDTVISSAANQVRELKSPVTTNPDTCPRPQIIKVPVATGGSYVIHYATGPVTIKRLPPAE